MTNDRDQQEKLDGAGEAGSAIAAFSIRRPVTITMAFLSMIVLGLISLGKIPLVLLPNVTFPGLFVYIPYPNATPEQIQESITRPVEEALATIPGIARMQSSSRSNAAEVGMFFDWETDISLIRADVREKIDQVRPDLPEDVREVFVRGFNTEDIPVVEGIISSKRDLRSSYDFLDLKLKKPLERIPGVAETELWGVNRQQLDVYLQLDDIKRYKVDVGRVFRTLNAVNTNVSLGLVDDGDSRHGAITKGAIESVEDVERFPVNERGLALADIADIVFDEPIRNNGQHLNGEYAVGFSIRKSSEANTVDTVRDAMAFIDSLADDPDFAGMEVHIWHNAGDEIIRSLTGLLQAGAIGAVLAVLTLFLFLRRVGPSLAIGMAIPFSVTAAIGFVYLWGGTLNVLSMMGLMLSTGMLVDNAVVVLESIYQKLEKGMPPEKAARVGAGEVTTAVIAATLTTIIVFVPLVFGKSSEFSIWFGHAGSSIITALLCSLFISLTLIPLAMGRYLKLGFAPGAGGGGPSKSSFTERYLAIMQWPLRHRYLAGFVLAPALIALSGYGMKAWVPDNTPEAQDQNRLGIQYEFSENFHYAKIEAEYVAAVEEFLGENKERFKIKDYMSRYNNNSASTWVYFDKEDVTIDELQEIRKQIGDNLPVVPGAEISLSGRQDGGSNNGWISANILGDDPATLTRIATELRSRLRENTGFGEVNTALQEGQEEVQIRLDRAKARKFGLSPDTVSQVLGIVVRAQQMRGFRTSQGEVEMWLRIDPADMQSLTDLRSIVVGAGPDGKPIALEQVAEFTMGKEPGRINREDRQTYTSLWALWSGDKKDEGRKAFTEVFDAYDYPDGYGWSFGFFTRRGDQDDKEALFDLALSLFMVYFVMASLFESLSHPFSIMISLPFAVVGVVAMLVVTNTPYNMMAMIGSFVLVGIVVNNGIVLLDHINNLRRRGLDRERAIIEGCRERFRPIVMTATTTIVGMIPLAFGNSGFFDMQYFPMARTIMGGLLASTVLTLIVLPTYYTLVDDFGAYLRRTWLATGPGARRGEAPAGAD